MSGPDRLRLNRRQFFGSTALASMGVLAASGLEGAPAPAGAATSSRRVEFFGAHQAGIATAAQDHLAFATFDVGGVNRRQLAEMLDAWSTAAAHLTAGEPVPGPGEPSYPPADTGEAVGLGPAGLTMTLGLGRSLFDRVPGLVARRPAGLVDLPPFPGDQLDPVRSDGDLCLQVCAEDPQVAFHAVHTMARLGLGTVALRNFQIGFGRTSSTTTAQSTPRNLLGFMDGTNNLLAEDTRGMDTFVWLGSDADQSWMSGGSYLVARRIRTRLELWGATSLGAQEAAVGRSKASGAPLSGTKEHDRVDLEATGTHGLPVIPAGAHIRVAGPSANGGTKILRRGYGFADGIDPVTGELDAGLFFISFQRDPIAQFALIQQRLAANDVLHEYLLHTSSGVYACPGGLAPAQSWGRIVA